MNTELNTLFEYFEKIVETCDELKGRLEDARKALTEDQFDDLLDGDAADIVAAAMDVEYWLDKCKAL